MKFAGLFNWINFKLKKWQQRRGKPAALAKLHSNPQFQTGKSERPAFRATCTWAPGEQLSRRWSLLIGSPSRAILSLTFYDYPTRAFFG
jgi:hypothetical protein